MTESASSPHYFITSDRKYRGQNQNCEIVQCDGLEYFKMVKARPSPRRASLIEAAAALCLERKLGGKLPKFKAYRAQLLHAYSESDQYL